VLLYCELDGDTKAGWQLCAGRALQSAVQQWSTEGATGCAVVSVYDCVCVCACAVCLMSGELICVYVCLSSVVLPQRCHRMDIFMAATVV